MEMTTDITCPWGIDSYCEGSFVLCLDGMYGAGDFVWSSLLISLARAERSIIIISASHSPEHWECLLRKNADLRRLGLENIYIKYVVPNSVVSEEERRYANSSSFCSDYCSWEELVKWQQQGMLQTPVKDKVLAPTLDKKHVETNINTNACVFVDDLNALEILSPNQRDARFFMNGLLHALHCNNNEHSIGAYAGALVVLGPAESPVTLDSCEEPSLTEVCKSRADITIAVVPLSTGYSQEVHGMVHITAMPVTTSTNGSKGRPGSLLEEIMSFKLVRPNTIISQRMTGKRTT